MTQAVTSTGFLSQNQTILGTLRPCDSGSDEYKFIESDSDDVSYATAL